MRRLLLVTLLGLLTVALAATPAAAARPEMFTETIDETFPDEFLSEECGFPVSVTLSGTVRVRIWLDAEGNPTRELVTINIRGTIGAGAGTLSFVDAGMDKATFLPGGGVRVEIHGNLGMVVAKGRGPVLGAAGRIVFTDIPVLDEEGNPVLDEDGHPISEFTLLADSGVRPFDIEAVCAALAPAA
jgi:hypothetical protein